MRYIETEEEVGRLVDAWFGRPLIAVDTEAAGYHRYEDVICLVQLTAGRETAIIDALAVPSLQPIASILADPETEIVFHDADFDLRLLDRDHGLHVRNLFDTRIAAQMVGERAFGLAALLEKHLGVRLEKKHQRADWARRPLPPEMLEYAAEDTRHLPALRDRLRERLVELERLEWAEEEFRLAEGTRHEEDGSPEFLRHKGIGDLSPRELAILREVHDWREEQGRRRDRATFRVLSREAMIELARNPPRTTDELRGVRGVGTRLVDSPAGESLLAAIRRGLRAPAEELPEPPARGPRAPRPSPEEEARIDRLRATRDAAADRLGLDRGFLMARWQLEEIARRAPRSRDELLAMPSIRGWQVEALGQDLLEEG